MLTNNSIPFVNIHSHNADVTDDICIYNCNDISEVELYFNRCSYGLHPWNVQSYQQIDTFCHELELLLQKRNLLCVGECGLDITKGIDFELQLYAFSKQVELAQRFNVPIIIHCVRAYYEIISILKKQRCTKPVIFHKFSGNSQIYSMCLKYDAYISLGPELCKHKSKHSVDFDFRLDRLLFETDTNSDVNISDVYNCFSEIYNIEFKQLKQQVYTNFLRVFQTK
jgi:TatD DNase family protein